jgi:hypothetical protein
VAAVTAHPDELVMWIWVGGMAIVLLCVGSLLAYVIIKELLTHWLD